MNEVSQYLLLFRYQRRMAQARLRRMLRESKLMLGTMAVFLAGYGILGYLLFSRGLSFVERLPGVGGFLGDRILFLIFFFFFIMLIFSVGITNFIGFIKGKEIPWMLSLPLSHRVIFLWKTTEAVVFASWGLIFVSAPLLFAFAVARDAPWTFYPKALLVLIPFVMVAATLGSTLFLALLRWISRRIGIAVGVMILIAAGLYAFSVYQDTVGEEYDSLGVVAIDQVLKHTEVSVHPLSPSTWLSRVLVQWTRDLQHGAGFFTALLWSYAFMGIVVLGWLGNGWFYPGWIKNLERTADAASRRQTRLAAQPLGVWKPARQVFGMHRPIRAVIRKDLITFVREPSQWVQFVIVFGLLFVYVLNLRNMGYDYESPFWAAIISYLNLTVCSLALSTLTTRFVFPQFSLEGSRLWILGMSPLGLERVVLQKWLQAVLFTGVLTTLIQFVSGLMLKLDRGDIAFFTGSVALMSIGLCGIAVGLGALFPNLEETNAAKIVSGFGGTLCLICSFIYIAGLVSVLCLAKINVFRTQGEVVEWGGSEGWFWTSLGLAALLTLIFGGVPLYFAGRRVKKLEFLGAL